MLLIRPGQRAVAAFFALVFLAVMAGGACIAFDAGVNVLSAPAAAATSIAATPQPAARREVRQETGTALEPAVASSAGG